MNMTPKPTGATANDLPRFMRKVEVVQNGCWMWTAYKDPCGYGRFEAAGRSKAAHRVAYELMIGPIPDGLCIDHICRTRGCVNPDHLRAVTAKENNLSSTNFAALNAAKTHCDNGHPFTDENVYRFRGSRHCRKCNSKNSSISRLKRMGKYAP